MGNAVAGLDRLEGDAEITEAIDRVVSSWDGTSAQMAFLAGGAGDSPRAVLAWPAPLPLLRDVCALFEHFGLQVARQRTVTSAPEDQMALSLSDFAAPGRWRPGIEAKVAAAIEASSACGFAIDAYASLIVSANVS